MATTIKLKNGTGVPSAGSLVVGEPALDLTNKRLYTEDSGGTVIEVGTNPTSLTTGTVTSTGFGSQLATTLFEQNVLKSSVTASSGAFVRMAVSSASNPTYAFEDDTDTGVFTSGANTLNFATAATERMRVDSSGHLIVPNGVTLGTAVGTYAAANTLDDYEEGTWTPVFNYSGGSGTGSWTYSVQEGKYTKIGRMVYFWMELRFSAYSKGTATGLPEIEGLPFAPGGVSNGEHYNVSFRSYNYPLPTTDGTYPGPVVALSANEIYLHTIVNNAAYGNMPDPDANTHLKLSGWYMTDA